jgi:hypothetical protein
MFDGGRPAERLTVQIWAGTGYARPARPGEGAGGVGEARPPPSRSDLLR